MKLLEEAGIYVFIVGILLPPRSVSVLISFL